MCVVVGKQIKFRQYRIGNILKVVLSGFSHIKSRLFREEFLRVLRSEKDIVSIKCTSYMYLQIRKHYNDSGMFADLSNPKHSTLFAQVYDVKIYVDNTLEKYTIILQEREQCPQQKKRRLK